MRIDTKYNIGDPHWSVQKGKAVSDAIFSISVYFQAAMDSLSIPRPEITYGFYGGGSIHEDSIIPTRESLISSL